jgi:hypothetical protein
MAEKGNENGPFRARVQFAGLKAGETPPAVAMYEVNTLGKPVRKLAAARDGAIEVQPEWEKAAGVALGPDTEDLGSLTADTLVAYRFDTIAPVWRDRGIIIGRGIWDRFRFEFVCVSGQVRKCRPWWWRRLEVLEASAGLQVAHTLALKTLADRPELRILPPSCVPLCDGIVEIYERVCCCHRIRIPDLLDRLRDILDRIPIPLPDPPIPIPDPGPDPAPFGGIDIGQLAAARALSPRPALQLREPAGILRQASKLRARLATTQLDAASSPSERLYDDYVALVGMPPVQAEEYVRARPYLLNIICFCTQHKVGEVPLQPGGRFDFCYLTTPALVTAGTWCHRSFGYKVRQRIQGQWVTVYDGIAAHDWFAEGTPADLRTGEWRALECGSGPGEGPQGEGQPFVILEYVGSSTTKHFNFPAQNGISRVGALAANSGTYTTGYAPDCPFGSSLGLRLWVHPDMQPIATYYRLSVVPVADTGLPSGGVTILDAPVTWSRFVLVGGEWVVTSELLSANPASVGGQQGLARIPYWSGGNHWLSSQYHQTWNTSLFADGKYLVVLELFDSGGARIKPNAAPASDPGAARPFQFRRWRFNDTSATDNVPFADAAHAFWVDNTPVQGAIVDIRKDDIANTAQCQFVSGVATTDVSVGFRAYHAHGVSNPANTFMYQYSLTWTRGLNGPSGSFAAGSADVGEPPAVPAESNVLDLGYLLGPFGPPPPHPNHHPAQQKCTFALHLHVAAKHFNGGGRLSGFDYHETASFALSL